MRVAGQGRRFILHWLAIPFMGSFSNLGRGAMCGTVAQARCLTAPHVLVLQGMLVSTRAALPALSCRPKGEATAGPGFLGRKAIRLLPYALGNYGAITTLHTGFTSFAVHTCVDWLGKGRDRARPAHAFTLLLLPLRDLSLVPCASSARIGQPRAAPSCRPWIWDSQAWGEAPQSLPTWPAFTSWFSLVPSAWRSSGASWYARQKIGACASSSRAWPRALDCPEKAACPCQRPGLLPPLATMPNTGKLQRVHVLVLLGKVHVRGSFDMPRKSLVRPCAGLARVFPYPDSASPCEGRPGPAIGKFCALPASCLVPPSSCRQYAPGMPQPPGPEHRAQSFTLPFSRPVCWPHVCLPILPKEKPTQGQYRPNMGFWLSLGGVQKGNSLQGKVPWLQLYAAIEHLPLPLFLQA